MKIDHKYQISKHFKLGEFTLMRRTKNYADFNYEVLRNIILLSDVMDKIRDYFNRPILITSGYRNDWYNKLIGGAERSKHLSGRAADFVVLDGKGIVDCDLVREQLKPLMGVYKFSMEDLPGSNWIHIDLDKRGEEYKFFKP